MKSVYKLVALWEDCYLITHDGDMILPWWKTWLIITRIAFLSLSLVYSSHPGDQSYVAKSPLYFSSKANKWLEGHLLPQWRLRLQSATVAIMGFARELGLSFPEYS